MRTPPWSSELVDHARDAGEDVPRNLALAAAYGHRLPEPGAGATTERWGVLTALGRVNLTTARIVEAHTDALAILTEAAAVDARDTGVTWGVFAAEAPGVVLTAEAAADGTCTVTGTKPWCSLGGALDAALVTARVGDRRQLFRVDLRAPGVRAEPAARWVARGLRTVTSGPVHFDRVPVRPVGGPGWYLTRPGFAWGGIGVAACWYGGAQGVADALARAAKPGELAALQLGAVDVALHAAGAVLAAAAVEVDAGVTGAAGETLALRVRAVVADSVERVLQQVGHALGPAPLAFDATHAARVADLALYVRQHHGERDLAALGAALRDGTAS